MEVACTNCQGRFKVPDEKLPQGQRFAINCPKCHGKITIDTRPDQAAAETATATTTTPKPAQTLMDEVAAGDYDADEKPFEVLEEGAKTALLCEPDPEVRARLKAILERMEFTATEPATAKAALKQMRFHVFDLVVLNETFDARQPQDNHVLNYLTHLGMGIRRNIVVALITRRFRSMDNMAAFHHSVNLMINLKNIGEAEKLLKRGLADNEAFYRVFKESLIKIGLV